MPRVNPKNLRWARETAGLDEASAAKKIGLNAARGIEAPDRLRQLENGEAEPTRRLLSKMATAYRRPLIAFYSAQPPRTAERVEDFRALPDRRPETEPLVQALVRDVRARQGLIRTVLEEDEAPTLAFVGSRRMAEGPAVVAEAICQTTGFRLERFRGSNNADAAFAYLRERIEAVGVFVLLIGDLGSHHTEIDTEAFRGFALADPIAPFVVVNDRDAHTAWAFTALHELAHICLGVTGVSGAHPTRNVERFCNDVASRILLPPDEALRLAIDVAADLDEISAAISAAARPRNLSRTLIAFRLFEARLIDEESWEALRARFAQEWRQTRARQRDERRGLEPESRGGPDYYTVRRQRLGRALVELVGRAVSEGTLTPTKAGKVLGISPRSVDPLVRSVAA
jgi:Zn-dependent peptidase ImmA (M78 family)/transcriptional regulator with XRE-family HTH domain